ncbi:MAG: 3-dehydroquinate synthase, partial [Erysipelotrichaceae bacterium]|nr:3-dehydroquinate synthase [Erysipelotrichaceae bacterium]
HEVAIGGVVTGDLAGFVAASYMRGISFVNVPTTTLSQIDSSIGGKTAINMDGVKNCVGAFHQPIAVFLDSMTLQSLPKRHYRNGMVEALKAGFIQDPVILDLMEEDVYKNESEIILRSLQMKKKIVEEDETEQGIRKILNFGHTIGHGIESYFDCKDVLHGEAVAVGMDKLLTGDNRKRLRRILDSLKIPYNLSYDTDKVLEYMLKDKKRTADTLTLVKVYTAGEAVLETVKVSELKNLL